MKIVLASGIIIGMLSWAAYHSYFNGLNAAHFLLIGTALFMFVSLARGKFSKETNTDTIKKEVTFLSGALWGFVALFLSIPILLFLVGLLSGIANR